MSSSNDLNGKCTSHSLKKEVISYVRETGPVQRGALGGEFGSKFKETRDKDKKAEGAWRAWLDEISELEVKSRIALLLKQS